MAHFFVAKPLTAESVDRAFTLAQAAVKGLELDQWRRFARMCMSQGPTRGGIFIVENRARTILGLATYRIEPALGFKSVCSVENFVTFDLLDNKAVAKTLVRALESLARRQGASAIRIAHTHGLSALGAPIDPLRDAGHCLDSILSFKRLRRRG